MRAKISLPAQFLKNINSDNIAFYVRRDAGISPRPKDSLEETILTLIEQSHHKHREGGEKFFRLHNFKVSVNKDGKTKSFDGDIQFYFEGEKAIHVRALPTFKTQDSLRTVTWRNSHEQVKNASLLKTIDLGYVFREGNPNGFSRSFRFLSFLGRGATVENMIQDMSLESRDKVSSATVGQRLSFLDPDISRQTLEKIASHGKDLDLWKNAFPVPSCDQEISSQIPQEKRETAILDFFKKYGRPPFVSSESLVEFETGRATTVNLFGRDLVVLRREKLDGKTTCVPKFYLAEGSKNQIASFWLSVEPFPVSFLSKSRSQTKLEVVFMQEQNGLYKLDFCQKNSFADFLKRMTISNRYTMVDNDLFMAEELITKSRRKLTDPELDALGKIFDKNFVFDIKEQDLVDRFGEKHELVVANLSESNPVNGKIVRGHFVLSDNGQVLVGRAILGGKASLRLSVIKNTFEKFQNTKEVER